MDSGNTMQCSNGGIRETVGRSNMFGRVKILGSEQVPLRDLLGDFPGFEQEQTRVQELKNKCYD